MDFGGREPEGVRDGGQEKIGGLYQRHDGSFESSRHVLDKLDLVIGLAASVRTPYTLAGLEYAAKVGAKTAFIVCNDKLEAPEHIDAVISLPVGPEAITGSTRMKSGDGQ